jgi:hypothetical protein
MSGIDLKATTVANSTHPAATADARTPTMCIVVPFLSADAEFGWRAANTGSGLGDESGPAHPALSTRPEDG